MSATEQLQPQRAERVGYRDVRVLMTGRGRARAVGAAEDREPDGRAPAGAAIDLHVDADRIVDRRLQTCDPAMHRGLECWIMWAPREADLDVRLHGHRWVH